MPAPVRFTGCHEPEPDGARTQTRASTPRSWPGLPTWCRQGCAIGRLEPYPDRGHKGQRPGRTRAGAPLPAGAARAVLPARAGFGPLGAAGQAGGAPGVRGHQRASVHVDRAHAGATGGVAGGGREHGLDVRLAGRAPGPGGRGHGRQPGPRALLHRRGCGARRRPASCWRRTPARTYAGSDAPARCPAAVPRPNGGPGGLRDAGREHVLLPRG